MTATAFALDPALDRFDDVEHVVPARPRLRLIDGGGHAGEAHGRVVGASRPIASIEVYRRRRFFALVAVTLLVLAGAWAAGVSVTDFSGASLAEASTAPSVHVVLPGDSYAAIAADLGAANPVAAGQRLQAANGGGELIVGQRLVVDVADLALSGVVD